MRNAAFAVLVALGLIAGSSQIATAQSGCPSIINGAVLTAAQWNACFAAKQNTLGYTPVNKAGDTMLGRLVTSAPGTSAGLNLTPGSAPSAPINGDLWTTSVGVFARINGSTVGPFVGLTDGFAGTSPIVVTVVGSTATVSFDFTVANTWLALQTAQGATTTSPGWYAKLAGDSVPRIRVGLNATDVASIGFGSGSATRDTFIERAAAATLRLGAPDAAAPVAQTLGVQNVVAGTSNTAGTNLTINGSQGTGSGAGGSIILQVAPAGGSGTSQNALSAALTLNSAKLATFGGHLVVEGVTSAGATGTGNFVFATSPSVSGLTVTGSFTATGLVTNADLANPATTVNGQTCTLGSTCTVTASATAITVGTTTVGSGTTTRILYDNAGVLGEYTLTGTGTVVAMQTAPTFVTSITTPIANLSGTSNQLVFQSAGVTGTISWTPATSNKTITLPNGTTDFTGTSGIVQQASGGAAFTVGSVALTNLATQATNTVVGNATSGSAAPTALAVGTCSTSSSALNWTTNTGFGCNTAINAATLGGATFAAPGTIGGGTPGNATFGSIILTGSFTGNAANANFELGAKASANTPFIDFNSSGNSNDYDYRLLATGGTTLGTGVLAVYGATMSFQTSTVSTSKSTGTVVLTGTGGLGVGGAIYTDTLAVITMATDAAHTDATVCRDTTTGVLYFGSGALGVCLGTSGAQFKTAFAPMRAGIDELMQIKMLNYRYLKGHGDSGARTQYGPTAQNVETVLPDLVGHNDNGEAINYDWGSLLFVGLHAIQQLKADNDNLRHEIEQIKRSVSR